MKESTLATHRNVEISVTNARKVFNGILLFHYSGKNTQGQTFQDFEVICIIVLVVTARWTVTISMNARMSVLMFESVFLGVKTPIL